MLPTPTPTSSPYTRLNDVKTEDAATHSRHRAKNSIPFEIKIILDNLLLKSRHHSSNVAHIFKFSARKRAYERRQHPANYPRECTIYLGTGPS